MLKEISYFLRSTTSNININKEEFNSEAHIEWINMHQVSSVSGELTALSKDGVIGSFHILTMVNCDVFFLRPGDHIDVLEAADSNSVMD